VVEQPQNELLLELYRLVDRLSAVQGLQPALDEVLEASLHLLQADMGHIRLSQGGPGRYNFAAQKGLPQDYLDYFAALPPEAIDAGPALQALNSGRLVVVEDVTTYPPFAPHLEIIAKAGYVAMLSRPLIDRGQRVVGALSAYFRRPGLPGPERLQILDLYARLATDAIEHAGREEALRESEQRYRVLSDLSPEAILVNQGQRWVYANRTAANMLAARQPEELLDRDPLEFIHPDFHERARARAQRILTEGESNPLLEQQWYRLDGTLFDCEVASAAITWEGRPAVLLICRDISERKQAQDAMISANRLKDEFLGLVSHELRTPLTTIRGYAGLLARRSLPEDLVQQSLDDLLAESERLNRIVENMLVLTRLEIGQAAPLEPTDVRKVIEQTIATFRSARPAGRIEIEDFATDSTAPAVAAYVEQVVQNLLSNAVKYSPADAPITISCDADDTTLRVHVADRGKGLSDAEGVFEAFVREPGTDRVAGLGIGLTVCKRLMEAQGGTISAAARAGGGSVFTIALPRRAASDAAHSASAS
jgi:PAS domain S-box-containing protein